MVVFLTMVPQVYTFEDELLAKGEGDIPIRYSVPRDGT
jgi:hypothetical protein